MKKIIPIFIIAVLIPFLGLAQGLEDIIVEKIPATANALSDDPNLPANSIAYRVFADLASGYEMQAVFSLAGHEMIIQTTTSFYNHSDFGGTSGKEIPNSLIASYPALAFDSYITIDAASNNRVGILRSEDVTDGIVDGVTTGTALALQTIGGDFGVPFGTEMFSGKFSTFSGIYNVNGGEQGTTASNRVLIGQFTTNGVFSFELNLQIRKGTTVERFVARNPKSGETEFSKLIYSSNAGTSPVVAITNPANAASFSEGSAINITATASDADGSITKVEFYSNGTLLGQDLSEPYQYNWTPQTGSYNITAKATDNDGITSTSLPVAITITSNSAPSVNITEPSNGATLVTGTAISIKADATDTDGSVTKVEFYANGTKVGEDISSPYQISWNPQSGTFNLTAKATDNMGSTTTSAPVGVTIGSGNVPPVISLTSPANNAVFTAGNIVNIAVNATDADGSVSKVEFFIDGGKIGEDLSLPYQFSWTSTQGSHMITAVATDNNNAYTTSTAITITVNGQQNVPPVISITSPANNTSYATGAGVSITANASDTDGSVSKVEFYIDGQKIGEDLLSPYQISWTSTQGSHALTAIATDNGNATTTSSGVNINVSSQQGPPTISITSPANGAILKTGSNAAFEASATDDGTVTLVEFFINDTKIGEDQSAPFQATWAASTPNIYTLTAKATDNSGMNTTSEAIIFTVTDNLPPTILLSSPANNATFSTGAVVKLLATASDPDGSISLVEFLRNGSKIGEDNTAPYEFDWSAVSGNSNLSARATDNMGAKANSPAIKVVVANGNSPVVNISSPASGSQFNAGDLVGISANATDADGSISLVEFYINGLKAGEDNTAPYSYSWISTEGDASITAKAIDNAGNQTLSSPVAIVINGTTTEFRDTVIFDFSKAIVVNNQYQLPVRVNSNRNITSFGFSTIVNTASISFQGVINHTTYLTNTHTLDANSHKLTVSSTSQQNIEKNIKLISLNFTLLTGAITASDLQQFKATMNNTECEVKVIFPVTPPIPPMVQLVAPTAGTYLSVGTSVVLQATASDQDGSITKVEFFVNDQKIGEDLNSPYENTWTAVSGSASLKAKATDNQGNQTVSPVIQITVNGASGNQIPVVSISEPLEGAMFAKGIAVSIKATANDADGTVSRVEFYVNDVKIGKDESSPFQINWTAQIGGATIKAIATDNKGAQSVPGIVHITVSGMPSVTLTSPVNNAEFNAGSMVNCVAEAQAAGSNITLVEFFINGYKTGQDESAPYEFKWLSSPGQASIVAIVTDASGAKVSSNHVKISVNALPDIDLLKPVDGEIFSVDENIRFEATASDPDGSITKVEFMIDGLKQGEVVTAPYTINWKGTEGTHVITANVTDNKGAISSSVPVTIHVVFPYKLESMNVPCSVDNFCLPLNVLKPIEDVIGYDITVSYGNKVMPTGNITVGKDLIASKYVDFGVNNNSESNTLNISVFLNSSAPNDVHFQGTGRLLCIEFMRNPTFNTEDTAVITVNSLLESYVTGVESILVKPSKISTYKDFIMKGSLVFWKDSSGIAYDASNPAKLLITDITASDENCSPLAGYAVHPDTAGKFEFDVQKGEFIQINRDILPSTQIQSAVNGMDAQLTMKALLGDLSFMPLAYQMIAMDVNMDGVISSGDISQINQRSIMMINEFKQAWNYNKQGVKIVDKPSKDWLFVNHRELSSNQSFTISSNYPEADGKGFTIQSIPQVDACLPLTINNIESCPWVESETFEGILLGDVNGNYNSVQADGKLKSTSAGEATIVFDLGHSRLYDNKMDFPVYYSAEYDVTSLDFEMLFNLEKLTYDTIFSQVSSMEEAFFYNEQDSALRFTSYSLSKYKPNLNLLYVRFDLIENELTKNDFDIPLSLLNGESVVPTITDYSPTTDIKELDLPEIKIYPNPAKDFVQVEATSDATLQIMDLEGRTIMIINEITAGKIQRIPVSHLSNGIYLFKFLSNNTYVVRKIIIHK